MSTSGLVVPIALWGHRPPAHRAIAVASLPNASCVISGGVDGELIVWDFADRRLLRPLFLLIAHDSAITAISAAGVLPTSTRFVSSSSDGHVCLWDSLDGRCVDSVHTVNIHRCIKAHAVSVVEEAGVQRIVRLFCIGDYAEVLVMDPQDLTVLVSLSSRVEPDWISSFVVITATARNDVVIGVSIAGMVKMWTLSDFDKHDLTRPFFEDESKWLSLRGVSSVHTFPANQRCMLVVTANSWTVVDVSDFSTLVTCPVGGNSCSSGFFISLDRCVICFVDGSASLVQLPRSRLTGKAVREKFGENCANLADMNEPFAFSVLCNLPSPPPSGLLQFAFAMNSVDVDMEQYLFRVDYSGNLSVWMIANHSDDEILALHTKEAGKKELPAIASESLARLWSRMRSRPADLLGDRTLTASLYIGRDGRLLLGFSDGSIALLSAMQLIQTQLLEGSTETPGSRTLAGHTAAVTALLYPHEENSRYDPQILVSAGMDFAVLLWNFVTGALIHRFCVHGGPVLRILLPPANCNTRIANCICTVGADHSVALLSLKETKCLLLASRQLFPVVEIRWRPLDDLLLLRCDDDSVYVWQMDTASLDRVVVGLQAEEVMTACEEQVGVVEGEDEAGASQAIQMFRAFRNKNMAVIKRIAVAGEDKGSSSLSEDDLRVSSSMCVQRLFKHGDSHMILFNIDSIIMGLLSSNEPVSSLGMHRNSGQLHVQVARLCISLLHAWFLDRDLDHVCMRKLALMRPRAPLCFGLVSRQGYISLSLPNASHESYEHFARAIHWQHAHSITTLHLLSLIATANTLMSMTSRDDVTKTNEGELDQQTRQGWSLLAALHCVLLPELVQPKGSYAAPRIELLARRWQDRCLEIREAARALLIRELNRLGVAGRRSLIATWVDFLPTRLDPTLSIFGERATIAAGGGGGEGAMVQATNESAIAIVDPTRDGDGESGVQQVRRNQATAIILLGVIGSEFPDELISGDSRSTAHSLLELLTAAPTALLPANSPLRRAAIDLIGRGFVVWQPHIDISKLLLGLLELSANCSEKLPTTGAVPLSPVADACRTARHALSLIASVRPPALITALSKEVARYNSLAQHQTLQLALQSPLLKARAEILRIIEQLCEKQYVEVVDLIIPLGEVLVHCLDTSLLKQRSLADIFPPITKFHMVAYCANTRRIAFGGRNGQVIVHELRAGKAQTLQGHTTPVTAVAFSEDGKHLAVYSADDAKISFWQTSQSFLGMGQSQIRLVRHQTAPSGFPVASPGGSPQPFRARLVWINAKALTLMLPNGKEYRFSL